MKPPDQTWALAIMPLWIKACATILIGIGLGVWFAGEAARRLDEDYFITTTRAGMERAVELLARLVSEAVLTGDEQKTDAIIKQYISDWPEVTYVHILGENGALFVEWQKKPITFGPGIFKFETPIEIGTQSFGVLSLYVDLNEIYNAMRRHISATRRREALILLSITLFVVSFVSYATVKVNEAAET